MNNEVEDIDNNIKEQDNNGELKEIDLSFMILIKNPNNDIILGKI